ncbi:MAG TPA: tyrosine recombinase XerC [Clostridiales bacterium]|nr:tyrosine recombinase XerC [Clostridiales bacterium]
MKITPAQKAPPIIRDFLLYNETVKGKSRTTIDEYFLDLQTFFRYIKMSKNLVTDSCEFEDISISDIDMDLIKSITVTDLYSFMVFCKNERSNSTTTRARKTSTIRSFFKYLKRINLIDVNPAEQLETPKIGKTLPKYLTLEQSVKLLHSVDGPFKERDYCILTLFLNCGLRLSELCNLNLSDIRSDNSLRIKGKGNKERIVYLNDACIKAIKAYLPHRPVEGVKASDKDALFLSKFRKRISTKTVQHIVYSYLKKAGLDGSGFSAHKLRHTAATLMYQHGNVDIRILKEILGHENLGTTQIYTHVSNEQTKAAISSNPLAKLASNDKEKTEG